jgi:hypothetical protein
MVPATGGFRGWQQRLHRGRMTRDEFQAWLTGLLEDRQVPVSRWKSGPDLEDLALTLDSRTIRLRIVRTSPGR